MTDFDGPYSELHDFALSMKIEYVHRFRYFKENRWSEFYVKSINGCEGTGEFRQKISGLIFSCQSRAREALALVKPEECMALLTQWKEEVHELRYLSVEDAIEYDESEYGPASTKHFTCLPIDNRVGNLDEAVHASTWKLLSKATEHYALEWVSLIADAESGILFLQNSELASAKSEHRRPFIAKSVIEQLDKVETDDFDLSKLISLCHEINNAYESNSPISVAVLTRAILDHVPPIFGKNSFSEVANQHGGRSLKSAMNHLDKAVRNLSDGLLHQHIRKRECVPQIDQMRFEMDLEQLLLEIARCLE